MTDRGPRGRPPGSGEARRSRRGGDPASVGEILADAARTIGLTPEMASLIADPREWADVVGDDLAASGRPVRFEDGELVVAAGDRIGETRLRYAADLVRDAVNEHIGTPRVRCVVVRRHDARGW